MTALSTDEAIRRALDATGETWTHQPLEGDNQRWLSTLGKVSLIAGVIRAQTTALGTWVEVSLAGLHEIDWQAHDFPRCAACDHYQGHHDQVGRCRHCGCVGPASDGTQAVAAMEGRPEPGCGCDDSEALRERIRELEASQGIQLSPEAAVLAAECLSTHRLEPSRVATLELVRRKLLAFAYGE